MTAAILVTSALLQLAAAVMALRLAGTMKPRLAWASIAAACLLMGLLRGNALLLSLATDGASPLDPTVETITLAISALMVVGASRVKGPAEPAQASTSEMPNSRNPLQEILDHTIAIVYVKDLQGRYLIANNETTRILGGPILGKTDFDLFPHEMAQRIRENDVRIAAEGRNQELDEAILHPDGSRHEYLSVKFPVVDSEGHCYGVGGISTDVTARIQAEAERRVFDAKLQQAQKLESLGVLCGGIAHDFNNLLVAIIGNIDLALDDGALAPESKEDLESALAASQTAASLCQQLLAYSGRGKLKVEGVDVSELAKRMTRLMEVSASRKVRLSCSLASGLPIVEADATQLMQVIMNLLTNAADAMTEQIGTVSITTRLTEISDCGPDNLVVGGELKAGSYVCLEVKDSGCGMDEKTKARLFEPFFTTKFTGRGLGLSATAGIVRGHRGAITLETRLGEGATFCVFLPVPAKPVAVAPPAHDATQAPRSDQHLVLVVDDEASVRKLAKKALERDGFRVLLAENGRVAIEQYRLRRLEIQLVLLDLTMPEMDGEQTFRALREIDPAANVVITSGYDEESMNRGSFTKETAGFLPKPYTAKQLVKCARDAII